MTTAVSHGRGGTGNIGQDDTQYVDGGIHREGDPAASGIPYSTGRGGASNIASATETATGPGDDDIVPEVTKVITTEGPYHGGRGGEGNIVSEPTKKKPHRAIASWLKVKLVAIARTAGRRKVGKTTEESKDEVDVKEEKKAEVVKKEEAKKEEIKEAPKAEVGQAEAPKQEPEIKPEEKKEEITTQESTTAGPSEVGKPLEQAPITDTTETATAVTTADAAPAETKPEDVKA